MRTIISTISLTTLCFIACDTKKEKPAEKPVITPTVAPKDLHGDWIKAAYIDDLAKTHSPLQSSKKLEGIAVFSFDTAQLKKDSSLTGNISFNGHEGGACTVFFKAGKTPRSIPIQAIEGFADKSHSELIVENNELLFMAYPSNGSAIADKYVKAWNEGVNIDSAIGYAARRVVLSGKWQAKESDNAKKIELEFQENGSVKGFPRYNRYDIATDFVAEPSKSDLIYFYDAKSKKPRTLQFKFIGTDTVNMTEKIRKKETIVYQLTKPKKNKSGLFSKSQ